MDWIERAFGWSPDNGDGSFELFLSLAGIVAIVAAVLVVNPRARTAFLRALGSIVPALTRRR